MVEFFKVGINQFARDYRCLPSVGWKMAQTKSNEWGDFRHNHRATQALFAFYGIIFTNPDATHLYPKKPIKIR